MAATSVISRPSVGLPQRKDPLVLSAARSLHLSYHRSSYYKASTAVTSGDSTLGCDKAKVVCISDTHNTQPDLPDGDILIHAGDLSQYGMFDEIQKQLNWLNTQAHEWKIVIAGNHDLLLDPEFVKAHPDRELENPGKARSDLKWGNIIYLNNSAVELELPDASSSSNSRRKVTIFGSPLTPRFGNFAFQYDPENPENHDIWEKIDIPAKTDILITHGPPFEHLDDGGKGCALLLKALWKIQPRLMVFGHIHPGRGQQILRFGDEVERCYKDILLNNHPWRNLIVMLWTTLWLRFITATSLAREQPRGQRDVKYCQLANAAILGSGRSIREPIIAYI